MGGMKFKLKALRKKIDKKAKKTTVKLEDPTNDFDGFVYEFEHSDPTKKKIQDLNDNLRKQHT